MNEKKEILEISIEDIIPNRFQPRLTFDVEALNELAGSIKEHGIIQPLVVRRVLDKYEIIAGERRYKAATLIGMQKVPCIVMNLNDNESAEVAVIENIQRKEMTPLEEAKSFKKLLDKGYLTQDELARRMGKSQSTVANKLRLLNLDDLVQDYILNGKISERHARSLLRITNKEEQRKVLVEILEKRLTVKQTDDLIKERYGVDNSIKTSNETISQNMSKPEVIIPINNVTNDINPQLNLINNLGKTNSVISSNPVFENSAPIEEHTDEIPYNPSLDIFKKDMISSINTSPIDSGLFTPVIEENHIEQPQSFIENKPTEIPNTDVNPLPMSNMKVSTQNIDSIINPSVFNSDTEVSQTSSTSQSVIQGMVGNNNNIVEEKPFSSFIERELTQNINEMTNTDVNPLPMSNVEFNNVSSQNIDSIINPSVFSSDTKTSQTVLSPPPVIQGMVGNNNIVEEKERKLVDINELLNQAPKEEKSFKEEEEIIDLSITTSSNNYKDVAEKINKVVSDLNSSGANIYKEEMNLENIYQIVIRIDK